MRFNVKIVYFNSKQDPTHEDGLLSAIRQAMPMVEVITFTDCNTLSEWLKVPPRLFFAAILNPDSDLVLYKLMPLRRLLIDRKLILVVPNQLQKDITLVHKFRPHHIQWVQDDYSTLISILQYWLVASQELDQQMENGTAPRQ